MGKGILIVVTASLMAGSMMLYQSKRTSVKSDEVQSRQQAKTLAREIARSAYNTASSRARAMDEQENKQPEDIVAALGTIDDPTTGSYQGGNFEYWAEMIQGSTYRVGARGTHSGASYTINGSRTAQDLLYVDEETCENGCTVKGTFEQSQAGYCSAIYLQRLIPKNNNGHGNNNDGVDSSNPGGSKEGEDSDPTVDDEKVKRITANYYVMEPEVIFTPGNNRDGASAEYETTLAPGTQLNFIMAVDADYNCEKEGEAGKDLKYNDSFFEHYRYALEESSDDLSLLAEADWAMTEEDPNQKGRWRISFEDLPSSKFNDKQLLDIKKNGYPDRNGDGFADSKHDAYWDGETYGGRGWTYDQRGEQGFIDNDKYLQDYGSVPDFSDQVFIIELIDGSSGPAS